MLSVRQLQDHMLRLSYRDGWRFEIYEDAWEGPHIRIIVAGLPDAFNPGKTIELDIRSALPPMDDVEQFERWLQWRLCRIESHESREFFRRDGQILFNPHAV